MNYIKLPLFKASFGFCTSKKTYLKEMQKHDVDIAHEFVMPTVHSFKVDNGVFFLFCMDKTQPLSNIDSIQVIQRGVIHMWQWARSTIQVELDDKREAYWINFITSEFLEDYFQEKGNL